MADTRDELAGVVDLFGGLARDELEQALVELAFKQGKDVDREAFAATIERAVADYYLVEVDPAASGDAEEDSEDVAEADSDRAEVDSDDSEADGDDAETDGDGTGADPAADATSETVLVAGPAAFPTVPENGEDLPHIMDVPDRDLDREGLGESVAERLREEARTVAAAGDADRARTLLDVSYDLEAWAPVETDDVRETLDRAFE